MSQDLPPDNLDDNDFDDQPPVPSMFPSWEKGGRPRNGYTPQGVDIIGEQLAGIYQGCKDYGDFNVDIKRKNEETNSYEYCGTYKNCSDTNIPMPDDIGRRYGSGKYQFIARYKNEKGKSQTKSYLVDIGKEYDKYLSPEALAEKNNTQRNAGHGEVKATGNPAMDSVAALAQLAKVAGLDKDKTNDNQLLVEVMKGKDELVAAMLKNQQAQPQQFAPSDAISLMTKIAELNKPQDKASEMFEALAKIISAQQPQQPQSNNTEVMVAMMKMQSDMMQAQMAAQQQASQATMAMFGTLITAMLGKPRDESFTEKIALKMFEGKKEDDFEKMTKYITFAKTLSGDKSNDSEDEANKLVDMILPYIPMLLQKTVDTLQVRAILKSIPEYQTLRSNPALQGKVVEMLEERVEDKEALQVVLEKTGLAEPQGGEVAMPSVPAFVPPAMAMPSSNEAAIAL